MARVVRTPLARDDLKQIGRYIAQESGSRVAALRMLDLMRQKMELYATQPELGESRPDLGSDVRHFPVKSYVVFYRPLDDGIEVLRILHGSRDIPAVWRRGE